MKTKLRIALLYGGRSGEHEISLRSACSVYRNLDREMFDCVLIGIDKHGVWYLQEEIPADAVFPEDRLPLVTGDARIVSAVPGKGFVTESGPVAVDLVFPVLHGTFGEDGTVQGLIELLDLPYTGAGVLGSSIGMDKATAKMLWSAAGLPVTDYTLLTPELFSKEISDAGIEVLAAEWRAAFGTSVFIKPSAAGSSVGVHMVDLDTPAAVQELRKALTDAFRYDAKVLVEKKITGREIECSVRGFPRLQASSPGEIVPNRPFYDYKAKYVDPDGARLCIPAELTPEKTEEVRDLAVKACTAADINGMARVDFLLEAGSGTVYLNEVNTIPGFTSISMYPLLFEAGGLRYRELLTEMIRDGLARCEARRELAYSYEFTSD